MPGNYWIKPYTDWTLEECRVNGLRPTDKVLDAFREGVERLEELRDRTLLRKLSCDTPSAFNKWFTLEELLMRIPNNYEIIDRYRPMIHTLTERGFLESRQLMYFNPDMALTDAFWNHLKRNEHFREYPLKDAAMYYLITNARIG